MLSVPVPPRCLDASGRCVALHVKVSLLLLYHCSMGGGGGGGEVVCVCRGGGLKSIDMIDSGFSALYNA